MTAVPAAVFFVIMDIEELRSFCLALPAATEDIKWEDNLVFSVGGKMFCLVPLQPPLRFSFKAAADDFEELCVRGGFEPAPYLARAKWVAVTQPSGLPAQEWRQLVAHSYELVKNTLPKRLRVELNI